MTAPLVCWMCDFIGLIFCVCPPFAILPSSVFHTTLSSAAVVFFSDLTSAWIILSPLHRSAQKHLSSYKPGKNKTKEEGKKAAAPRRLLHICPKWMLEILLTPHRSNFCLTSALEPDWTWATRLARPLSHMGDLTSFKLAQMGRLANRRSNRPGPFMTSAFFPPVQLLHSI